MNRTHANNKTKAWIVWERGKSFYVVVCRRADSISVPHQIYSYVGMKKGWDMWTAFQWKQN
jgi:hypothetical protein